jgi:fluoride exporter
VSASHESVPDLPIDPDVEQASGTLNVHRAHRRWDIALVVAAGGAIGGALRYLLNQAVPHGAGGFPWSTFLENVAGCLVLGALMVFLLDVWTPHRYARPFLGIGVLGGFTTFSAYTVETIALLRAGEAPTAMAYVLGTVVLGLLATWAGIVAARRVAGVSPRQG